MNICNKIDVLNKISDDMKKVIEYQILHATNKPALNNEQMRQNYEDERKFWNEGGPKMYKIFEIFVKFKSRDIRTRIYYPNLQDEYKTIFFIHGGGFVVGSIDTHDKIMRILADQSKCAVVGIDYSLAPKEKFPTQILECEAVVEYVLKNAKEFKLSNQFVAYAGDSAGANMCFGLFLHQRDGDKNINNVKAMALFYGLYGLSDSASRTLYGNEMDWLRKEDLEYYYKEYLQTADDRSSKFVNIFNANLTYGVPPCFIAACEYDPLKDDSLALYEILKEYNNSKFKEYKGVMHAFLHYSKMMDIATKALQDGANFISDEFKIL